MPSIELKLHWAQHVFGHGKSNSTQMLDYYNDIYCFLDIRVQYDGIYLDLAFDKVQHALKHKLLSYGFSGNLYAWLCDYITTIFC